MRKSEHPCITSKTNTPRTIRDVKSRKTHKHVVVPPPSPANTNAPQAIDESADILADEFEAA